MKRQLLLILVLCMTVLSVSFVQAQEQTYSGVVRSASDGQPIPGATVVVVGTTTGVSTDLYGQYSIRARVGDQLRFSFLGLAEQTFTLGTTTTIDVFLEEEDSAIDDIVVVAYGVTRKRDLTGSISAIDSRILTDQSNSTVSRALEGAIPGLQVSNIAGQPGEDMKIRVRGLTSPNGDNNALIVIDGVASSNPSALAQLNPRDIESIVVSKDAAANSLYGSRGANGVILVTTKKGKSGAAVVTFDARFGINMQGLQNAKRVDQPQDIYEYAWRSIYNSVRYKDVDRIDENGNGWKNGVQTMSHAEAGEFASKYLFRYDGSDLQTGSWLTASHNGLGNYMLYEVPGATYDANGIPNNGTYLIDPNTGKLNESARLLYYDHDAFTEEFNRPRFRQEYNLSISGGSEKVDYFISGGYLNDPSYVTGSEFQRYNFRSNVNAQIKDWLRGGINFAYTRRYLRQPAVRWGGYNPGTVTQNIFYWLRSITALKTLYARYADGTYKLDAEGNRIPDLGSGQTDSPVGETYRGYSGATPLVTVKEDKWETTTDDLTGRAYLEAKFLRDFTMTVNLNMDNTYSHENRWNNKYMGGEEGNGGRKRVTDYNYLRINTQQLLTWRRSFDRHNLDVMIGHEYEWFHRRGIQLNKYMMLIDDMDDFNNFVGIDAGSTGGSQLTSVLEGYMLRANYNYDNRYYFSGSVRYDGTSRFKTTATRWGTFWSVGGGWRISEEGWLKDTRWIDDLKLRADYGTMGNLAGVSDYAGYNLWSLGNSGTIAAPVTSISQSTLGNPDLTWETVKTFNVGADFRFWDRFYGSLDFFVRNTTDMIWDRPNAVSTGVTTKRENTASMRNTGFEFEMGVDIIKKRDVLWSFSINGAHIKNILTALPDGVGTEALGGNYQSGDYLRGVGLPYYNIYMPKYAGVDQNTGLALLYHTVDQADHDAGRWTSEALGAIVTTTEGALATRYELGDATPDLIGGFSTYFTYKNFDVSANFAFQLGGKYFCKEFVYGGYASQAIGTQVGYIWMDAWTPDNRDSNLPMRMLGGTNYGVNPYGDTYTDYFSLRSASYLSVKNITVGYSLPDRLMERWNMGAIRFYVSLDNMWLISKERGFDPRLAFDGGFGVGAYAYPAVRSCSLGINVTF